MRERKRPMSELKAIDDICQRIAGGDKETLLGLGTVLIDCLPPAVALELGARLVSASMKEIEKTLKETKK